MEKFKEFASVAWKKFLYWWAFPPFRIGLGVFCMIAALVHVLLRDGSVYVGLVILIIGMGIFIHGLVEGTPSGYFDRKSSAVASQTQPLAPVNSPASAPGSGRQPAPAGS
jgi:hypothetical protein